MCNSFFKRLNLCCTKYHWIGAGKDGIFAEHMFYADSSVCNHLSSLLNVCLIHRKTLQGCIQTVIVPICKNKNRMGTFVMLGTIYPCFPLWQPGDGATCSVATLLLLKSTRFMIKKHQIHKKTLDYKSKQTHSENAQKIGCNAYQTLCKLIGNQRQRKQEIAAMLAFVCTGH